MKKIVGGVLLLAAMAIGLAVALPVLIDLKRYQNQYQPVIERALNRTVLVQDIRLALWPTIGVRVTGLSILDDPTFGADPFVAVASFNVGVRLLPLLTGKIDVDEITLHDPVMTVMKNQRGVLNLATVGRRGKEAPTIPSRAPIPSLEGPLNILGLVAVERVSVSGGRVVYRDLSTANPTEFVVKDLDLQLHSVGIGRTPYLRLAAVVQPFNVPFSLYGTFGPLEATANIDAINLQLKLGSTSVTATGKIAGHDATFVLYAPTIKMAEFPPVPPSLKPVAMEDCSMTVKVTGQEVELTTFSCRMFGGVVKGQGTVVTGSDAPPFEGTIGFQGLQIGTALKALTDTQLSVSGTVEATFTFNGRGFTMPHLIKSLEGAGRIVVKNGMIRSVDLPGDTRALLHAAGISLGVTDPIAFQTLEADGIVGGSMITVRRLLVEGSDVQATAAGTIGFDQTLNLTARLSLSPDLSRRLAKTSLVANLMMQDDRVIFPLAITGTLQEPLYRLDFKGVAERIQSSIQQKASGAMTEWLRGTMPEPIGQQGRRWLQRLFETIETVSKSNE